MRKLRENLIAYGELVSMTTLTAPGVDAGLVWDTACQAAPNSARHFQASKSAPPSGPGLVSGAQAESRSDGA
jgi:hypothetical protein